MTESILLIDLSAIYWASWFSSANDDVSAAQERTLRFVRELTKDATNVAICCDEGTSFRKALFPAYKEQREKRPPASYDELRKTKERLVADGLLLWGVSGYEADDIQATACRIARERGMNVVIATGDKDLFQLIDGDTVTVLSTITSELRDEAAVIAKFGIPPSKFRDYLALTGDKSDNIPGVDKVGAIAAKNLLTKYGDIEGIYAAACSNEETPEFLTPVIRGNIVNGRDKLGLSRELVTLKTDAPIDFDAIFTKREQTKLETREYPMLDTIEPEVFEAEEVKSSPPLQDEKPKPAPELQPKDEALVRFVPYERELQPHNSTSAWKLAQILYSSRLYTKFPNAESIMAIIIRGREMGLDALTALDCFHIIEGKPVAYAWLMIARAKEHPDCEYFQCTETTDKLATWETKNRRNPKPTTLTTTMEQVKLAGLARGQWLKTPDDMLRKLTGVKLQRMEYPSAALGIYGDVEFGNGGDE